MFSPDTSVQCYHAQLLFFYLLFVRPGAGGNLLVDKTEALTVPQIES